MKIRNSILKVALVGAGFAVAASPFVTPGLLVHADGFDGNAYLVWECDETTVCYHLFDDINTDNTTTFYQDGFSADNYNTHTFDAKTANEDNATFALVADFTPVKDTATSIEYLKDEEIALNPLEAPIEENAFSSFGDRNFKVTIASPEYVGVVLKNTTEGYEPDFGSALNSVLSHDISESTEAKPTTLYTVPMQNKISLSMGGSTTNFDNVVATNLENEDAVIITKNTGTNSWDIEFKSAYYDRVIFKLTVGTTNYYVRIFRTAIQVQQVDVEPSSNKATAVVYFDSSKNCDSFDVYAKIAYKTGATKTVKMSPADNHDDGYGNIEDGCLAEGGTGLKKGYYTYTLDTTLNNLAGIYYTVSNTGSTSSVYTGTVTGSKKGIYLDLDLTSEYARRINPEKN